MTVHENNSPDRTRTMRVPRTRGAVSGLLLIVLGAWGALIPFIGPYFHYSYQSTQTWHWTMARFWLEVLPGAVAVLGGLFVLVSKHRLSGSLGGWLAAAAGAWFVIGQSLAPSWRIGNVGDPLSSRDRGRAAAQLGYFYGLGVIIVFLAAFALGRLAVVGLSDLRAAQRDDERAAQVARQAEVDRQAELARQAEVDRQGELARQAEVDRQGAAGRQGELARQAEVDRQGAAGRQADVVQPESGRQADQPASSSDAGSHTAEDRPAGEQRAADRDSASYDPADGRSPAHSPEAVEQNPYDPRS